MNKIIQGLIALWKATFGRVGRVTDAYQKRTDKILEHYGCDPETLAQLAKDVEQLESDD